MASATNTTGRPPASMASGNNDVESKERDWSKYGHVTRIVNDREKTTTSRPIATDGRATFYTVLNAAPRIFHRDDHRDDAGCCNVWSDPKVDIAPKGSVESRSVDAQATAPCEPD
ncbi:hypothetical protein CTRI78_v000254 [Colletotrichum trifolii]|uniref:Uncharacterized protein n=1 Tax=Colletotrichum trifolii TaxID=5466 RepID=A0A4R8RSG2_COLTR|nr:hypothetical protein CTRI78_v000254 [Colletotrichum trifolii]